MNMQNRFILQFLVFVVLFPVAAMVSAQESTASDNVRTFTIDAPELGGARKVWLYLPTDYGTSRKQYPVIYMHDAQNLFDASASFAGEWKVDETLDSLNAKVIVVGIEHGNEKRIAELTPFPNPKYGGGNADAYLSFLIQTLKPHIDKNYRTKSGRKNTAIVGSSLGGLVSFYASIKYPTVFGKAGVLSPSFWFNERIFTYADSVPKVRTKMFFLAGDSESENLVSETNRMAALIESKSNARVRTEIIPKGEHNEKLWRGQFANVYLWLFNKS